MSVEAGVIGEGSELRLHFSLALADGEQVDGNFDREPARCSLGDGSFLPGFERCLLGLRAGDSETFTLPPAEAFGERKEANVQTFKRSRFAGMMLEEGLVVSFADAAKSELPGVVTRVQEDLVTVDFNHPLAGETLIFKVLIIDVH